MAPLIAWTPSPRTRPVPAGPRQSRPAPEKVGGHQEYAIVCVCCYRGVIRAEGTSRQLARPALDRDTAALLFVADMYGVQLDQLATVLGVSDRRAADIAARWVARGHAETGRLSPGARWAWLTKAGPDGLRAALRREPARAVPAGAPARGHRGPARAGGGAGLRRGGRALAQRAAPAGPAGRPPGPPRAPARRRGPLAGPARLPARTRDLAARPRPASAGPSRSS